jgi:hypothetical protein
VRFEITHPVNGNTIAYGFDHVLGFFVETGPISYDVFHPKYDIGKPLRGTLEFFTTPLVELFTMDDLDAAIVWLADRGRKKPPKRLVLAVRVITDLKEAAD